MKSSSASREMRHRHRDKLVRGMPSQHRQREHNNHIAIIGNPRHLITRRARAINEHRRRHEKHLDVRREERSRNHRHNPQLAHSRSSSKASSEIFLGERRLHEQPKKPPRNPQHRQLPSTIASIIALRQRIVVICEAAAAQNVEKAKWRGTSRRQARHLHNKSPYQSSRRNLRLEPGEAHGVNYGVGK